MKSIVILILCIAVVVQARSVKNGEASTLKSIVVGERIIQGETAKDRQFPHMAYLNVGCGGSLIDAKWVLTAFHCVESSPDSVIVEFGDSKFNMAVRVSKIYNNQANVHMDISLLELEKPVTFTDNIRPVRLPNNKDDLYVGEVAAISGMGLIDNNRLPDVLQYAKLKVISNDECKNLSPYAVYPFELCAVGIKSRSQGTCMGDSGGGLVLKRPGGDILIGVASFLTSENCMDPNPSGFVRVNYYLDWIKKTTKLDILGEDRELLVIPLNNP